MHNTQIKNLLILFVLYQLIAHSLNGQNTRINTFENIGWYNYFGTIKLSQKISIHNEYQWRRNNLITHWQQGLTRIGINLQPNPRVLFRIGYAWAETYPYGEIPINVFGRDFTEHRLFQMIQLSHVESIAEFSHRFILEQRFIGKYSSVNAVREDEFSLLNRVRYLFRIQIPLKGSQILDKAPYVAFYDEVFIGFGKNVNVNIFDQNRIGVILGYKFNKNVRIEVGYLNQIIQFGRQINKQSVFQYNNGVLINTLLNLDLSKSSMQ